MVRLTISQVRTYLAQQHVVAAEMFAKRSEEVEASGRGRTLVPSDLQSYVMATLFAAVAYLEATINEVFADASDPNAHGVFGRGAEWWQRMAALWAHGVPRSARYSVLEKYDIALLISDREPFHRGREPYQGAKLVVELRNALIHYEPEWIVLRAEQAAGRQVGHKFDDRLRGRFAENPHADPQDAFFPTRCLSAGCADWAVKASRSFVSEFWQKLGYRPPMHLWRGVQVPVPSEAPENKGGKE